VLNRHSRVKLSEANEALCAYSRNGCDAHVGERFVALWRSAASARFLPAAATAPGQHSQPIGAIASARPFDGLHTLLSRDTVGHERSLFDVIMVYFEPLRPFQLGAAPMLLLDTCASVHLCGAHLAQRGSSFRPMSPIPGKGHGSQGGGRRAASIHNASCSCLFMHTSARYIILHLAFTVTTSLLTISRASNCQVRRNLDEMEHEKKSAEAQAKTASELQQAMTVRNRIQQAFTCASLNTHIT
jgi:hypothetical protein